MWRLSLLVVTLCPWGSFSLLGWVESPGYPRGYPPHSSEKWSRCAPEGHTLSITLTHMDLEDSHDCENDAVKVYSDGNLISVLCGTLSFAELQRSVNPELWSNPGGCLNLTFHSDFSNHQRHSGFRGFYTIQDYDECEDQDNRCSHFCHNLIGGYYCSCRHGFHLDSDNHTCTVSCSEDLSGQTEGRVSSPSWPGLYPENSRCVFTLSVKPHLQLLLTFFQPFDLEQDPEGACMDRLRIETHSGTLGPFCGRTPPPSPLKTHSHQVKIHFESDGYGTNSGFSLTFIATEKVCLPAISPNSSVTPQTAEYSPDQRVTVTCDLGHYVNVVQNDGKSKKRANEYVTTCQRTGEWTPHYTCKPVNCGQPKIPQNSLLVVVGPDKPQTLYQSQVRFNCSSPFYTLQGDDTYTCGPDGKWISSDDNLQLPKCIEVCGMPITAPLSTGRIIGGENAILGYMPWYLLVKWPSRGGASLISDRWAVTAAHVVDGFETANLRWQGGTVDGKNKVFVELQSQKIIIHPGYSKGTPLHLRTNFDNDIALIRFTSRVELGPQISPICLPDNNSILRVNDLGTIAGFGVKDNLTRLSQFLKYAPIQVISEDTCRRTPQNGQMRYTNNMFCAGAQGKDSCEKDSGGPFFIPMLGRGRDRIDSWELCLGVPPCHVTDYKGYYTKVKNYVPWIRETIEATEKSLEESDEI